MEGLENPGQERGEPFLPTARVIKGMSGVTLSQDEGRGDRN